MLKVIVFAAIFFTSHHSTVKSCYSLKQIIGKYSKYNQQGFVAFI